MLGLVGLAIVETIPASAAADQAVSPNQSLQVIETSAYQVNETMAQLVSLDAPRVEPLPVEKITAKSDESKIEALESRLRWVSSLRDEPDSDWTDATTTAIRKFQAKNHLPADGIASTKTVQKLNVVAGNGRLDPRCLTAGIHICLDKGEKVARYVKNGEVIREIDVNIGPEPGDPKFGQYSSTRTGVNKIKEKNRDAVSSLYGYSMPFWMQFDGGIGFHFSEYFSKAGYADTSMGCTTIGNRADAEWLFNHSPIGTTVVVYK